MDQESDRINAAALLLARGRPLQPALVCRGRTVPYGELRKSVARAATAWQECGVAPGEVVMLRGDNDLEHVIAFLGAMWAGAVPVPLRRAIDTAAPGGAGAPAPVRFVLKRGDDGDAEAAPAWQEWDHETARSGPPAPAVPCEPGSPACWTDPRGWAGGNALVLPHRFALGLRAVPGTLPLAATDSMLGVLRALRRGVTAVLPAHGRAQVAAA